MEAKSAKSRRPVKTLPFGWEARKGLNERVYYHSQLNQAIQILPPPECWSCTHGLSYGWELAVDAENKPYFINHVLQQTTYNDPRIAGDGSGATSSEQHPTPRQYTLTRDKELGFGFIAGSEKPVIVRSVTAGGPSDGRLQAGDRIIMIGDEMVAAAPRDRVVNLIRESERSVVLTVVQPAEVANSSILKQEKKKQSKGMNQSRVRFAEESDAGSGKIVDGGHGTLGVSLEVGPSRSFRYDNGTTAGDIVSLLCEKLEIKDTKLYSLVLVSDKPKNSSLVESFSKYSDDILIPSWESIDKVVNNSSYKHYKCHLKMAFVAKDVHQLARDDPMSFDYLYQQCVNDVVSGSVYQEDLSPEDLFRLASLHILVVCLQEERSAPTHSEEPVRRTSKKQNYPLSKFNLKRVEKDYGFSKFLPPFLVERLSGSSKEHRKTLQQQIKTNHSNFIVNFSANNGVSPSSSPSHSPRDVPPGVILPRLQMQYIKSLSHFHMYGGKYFEATILALVESDITLLVGHHYGVSQLINSKTKMASKFADFSVIEHVEVAPYKPGAKSTNVRVEFKEAAPLVMSMHPQSALNFSSLTSGYCSVHGNSDVMLTLPVLNGDMAPDYFGEHDVKPSDWNYPPDSDSSSYQCDFSNPLNFSLLAEEIPASVRAMFQQSKLTTEEEDDDESEDFSDEEANSANHFPAPVDEGVAMATVDASPKSSVSSMACASPSSGIGSVASHGDPSERERASASSDKMESSSSDERHPRKSDTSGEGTWSELVAAVYDEAARSGEGKRGDDSDSATDENRMEKGAEISDSEPVSSAAESTAPVDAVATVDSDNGERSGWREQDGTSSNEAHQQRKDSETEQSTPRSRFSSFKPDEPLTQPPEGHRLTSSSLGSSTDGRALTHEEFQAKLGRKGFAFPDQSTSEAAENDEITTSPLVVQDLAMGHKGLSSAGKTRKNRFVLGGSLPATSSAEKSAGNNGSSRKRRFRFFNIFPTRRTYSMEKGNKRASSHSVDGEPETKRKWKFFGFLRSSSSSSSTRKSRFSLFGRKKRSHQLDPVNSPPGAGEAYSVFAARERDGPPDTDALKQSASYENIAFREKDSVDANPRPVSFMTFKQLPADDSEDEKNVEDLSPDRAGVASGPTSPPIDNATRADSVSDASSIKSNSSVRSSRRSSRQEVVEIASSSTSHHVTTDHHVTADDLSTHRNENVEEVVSTPGPPTKAKRKAPPPPPASEPPKDQEDHSSSSDESVVDPAEELHSQKADADDFETTSSLSIAPDRLSERNEDRDDAEVLEEQQHCDVPLAREEAEPTSLGVGSERNSSRNFEDIQSSVHEIDPFDRGSPPPSSTTSSSEESEIEDDLVSQVLSHLHIDDERVHDEPEVASDDEPEVASVDEPEDASERGKEEVASGQEHESDVASPNNDEHSVDFQYGGRFERASSSSSEDAENLDALPPNTLPVHVEDVTSNTPVHVEDVSSSTPVHVEDVTSYDSKVDEKQSSLDDSIEEKPVRDEDTMSEKDERDVAAPVERSIENFLGEDEEAGEELPSPPRTGSVIAPESPTSWNEASRDEESLSQAEEEELVTEKPRGFASALNHLLLNGLDGTDWSEAPNDSTSSRFDGQLSQTRRESELLIASSGVDSSNSPKDDRLMKNGSGEVYSTEEGNRVSSDQMLSRLEVASDVSPISPVPKIRPGHSKIFPPRDEFKVPGMETISTDVKRDINQNGTDESKTLPESSVSLVPPTSNNVESKEISPAASKSTLSQADDIPSDHASPKPKMDGYHNLIAPRLFGQKWEKKAFSRIKPPTSGRSRVTKEDSTIEGTVSGSGSSFVNPGVITHVEYPISSRNGRPKPPVKPSFLQQKSVNS